jgi:transposase-like protein
LSISEIARKLGVSRQLLQRYAHEARGGEQPEESSPK